MKPYVKSAAALLLYCCATSVFAETEVTKGVMDQFKGAALQIHDDLVNPALKTACAAVLLQWIFTYWKELFNADLSNSLAKAVGLITWFGATVLMINNADLLTNAFDGYLALAGSLSNISGNDFTPGALIVKGIDMIDATNQAFKVATGDHWWQFMENIGGALMLVFANIFTFLAFLVIALSLFVAQLEFWIMFAVAPLAFALIPLSAFRDQGFAPVKGVISLGLRILILGLVVAVTNSLTTTVVDLFTNPGLPAGEGVFTPIWYYLAGMAGCAMMSLSAGKIASSIASGSASFSGADAIKGGMQMAAVAGAGALAAGGLMSMAGRAGQSALGAAPGAGRALGKAMSAAENFMSGGKMGVSPAGGGGASGGGSESASSGESAPGSNFGGPVNQERPSFDSGSASGGGGDSSGSSSSASSGGADSAAPSSSAGTALPAGNASSAGIGGGGAGMSNDQLLKALKPQAPSALQKMGSASKTAGDHLSQDAHAVGVQIHVSKD